MSKNTNYIAAQLRELADDIEVLSLSESSIYIVDVSVAFHDEEEWALFDSILSDRMYESVTTKDNFQHQHRRDWLFNEIGVGAYVLKEK